VARDPWKKPSGNRGSTYGAAGRRALCFGGLGRQHVASVDDDLTSITSRPLEAEELLVGVRMLSRIEKKKASRQAGLLHAAACRRAVASKSKPKWHCLRSMRNSRV